MASLKSGGEGCCDFFWKIGDPTDRAGKQHLKPQEEVQSGAVLGQEGFMSGRHDRHRKDEYSVTRGNGSGNFHAIDANGEPEGS